MGKATEGDPRGFRDRFLELVFDPLMHMFLWRPAGGWGLFALIILLLAGGYQVTPGREWVDLGWPVGVYYGIAAAAGALVGFLGGQRRALAAVAGAVVAAGSLAAVGLLFWTVPQIPPKLVWAWVNVVALAVGLLPGVCLYAVVDRLLGGGTADASKAEARLERRRRERGLPPQG